MTATDIDTQDDHATDLVVENMADELVGLNDHKLIGRLWIGGSLLFLLVISVLGVVNNIERMSLGSTDIYGTVASYFQGWVLYRTGAIFLVAIPLFVGIASVVVPLQVGSASIAFPRLAAAAFWSWFVGAIVHIISFLADGGLGPENATRSEGTLLTLVSLGFIIVSLLAASVCIATTVIALRPVGMTLQRVPAFSWSMLVATSVWLLSLPVLVANLIFAYADLQGRPPIRFGLRDDMWANLEWAWAQPQVYAYAIPVLGVLAEIVPVAAKQRQVGRNAIFTLIGLFGLLSFGAWAQHALSVGADPVFQADTLAPESQGNFIYEEFLYIAFAVVIVLPVLGILGGVADTVRRGTAPKPSGGLVGAGVGAVLLLLAVIVGHVRVLGDLSGVPGVSDLWDALHDNHVLLSSATAQLSLVVAAVVASAIGALAYWSPKIFGGYAADPLAMLASVAMLGGGALAGIADLVSALSGQPDISVADLGNGTVDGMNLIATIGVALMAVGALTAIGVILPALRSDETLPDDPWDGHTLEWAAPSPPPVGNFVEPIMTITSAEPLLDELEEVN